LPVSLGMEKEFKSHRKIAEEEKLYRFKRFEDYMSAADRGEISRRLALSALGEEINYNREEE